MGFEKLGDSLRSFFNQQFGVYENVPTNPTDPYDYSQLGPFEQVIDKSEERRYLEDGSLRNIRPRNLEILMQEPDAVLIIKKRQFSSLAENYRYDLMNNQEKNYIKAVKRLFYNKCRLISAHERLSKIERIVANNGCINAYVLPQIYSSVEIINSIEPGTISGSTLSTLESLKQIKHLSNPNTTTSWINNAEIPYLADVGEGTGVIELTTFTSFQSTVSTQFGQGSASFNIEDPYKIMVITTADIEKAISDTVGFTNNPFFNTTAGLLDQTIKDLQEQLSQLRIARNVPQIKFLQNQNSLLFKRIRAVIDEEGREIIFSYDGGVLGLGGEVVLDASATLTANGLASAEVPIFQQIIQNMYVSFGLEDTRRNQIKEFNGQNNFIRERMMLDFDGKSIVGVNDVVHLFVSSKTIPDSRIAQGFNANFSSDNILSKIDSAIGNIDTSVENIVAGFSNDQDSFINAEKNAIVGEDFPLWLWTLIRTEFTRQTAGPQVFCGVVTTVSHNTNAGFYNLNFNAADNCAYLNMGQINIKPSVSVIDSSLYDPLTPFNVDYDPATGFINGDIPPLLDENISLINSGCVKFKAGRNKGLPFNQDTYNIKDLEVISPENLAQAKFRIKFHDPDGLVYRWKRGIGSFTASGAPHAFGTGSLRNETSPVITNDPFAGQDVMNVLSLLITGQPYNFNTFMRAAVNSGMVTRDELFNQSWSESFLKGLISDITRNNAIWGNFVPFKKLIINNEAYNFLRSGEFDITTATRKITQLLKDRSERFDQLTTIFPDLANNPQFYKVAPGGTLNIDSSVLDGLDKNSITNLAKDIIDLDLQITQQQQFLGQQAQQSNIKTADGSLRIVGDDITYDPTLTSTSELTLEEQRKAREDFRKRIFSLTQRRFFKVKANQDINYFIVDDAYDKNYDVQAFEATLGGALSTFRSTYTKTGDKAKMVADLLGLELYADSQGHINARPPAYNRIPSSVFYEMLRKKNTQGIQIFPSYLEKLFFHQIQGLTQKIEILEDQIRLRTAVLGYVDDQGSSNLLSGSQLVGSNPGGLRFFFLTLEGDGKLGGQSLRNLLMEANPDFTQEINQQALSEFSSALKYPNNSQINFDIIKRVEVTNFQDTTVANANPDSISDRFTQVSNRLKSNSILVPSFNDLMPNDKSAIGRGLSQVDILSITEQLSSFLSERQYVVKLLANALKNLNQGIQVNSDIDPAKGSLLSSINKDINIPEILEHMIEDERLDDLGERSGQRFIIKDVDIISLNVRENPPPFTIAEVNGALANALVQGPSGAEIGESGNFVSTALAVDYDMWRQYGFRGHSAVSVPFLSDPDAQCAPYAVWLLNQARKNIFNASLSTRGNEYYQAGEVYYVPDRDLLFYTDSVSHSFTFGQTFTSSFNMTFVHKPGQFIPTQLDIIGKGLYANRNQADLVKHVRNDNPSGDIPITVIVSDGAPDQSSDDADINQDQLTELVSNNFGTQNRQNLATLSLSTSGLLTPTRDTDQMSIEIRVYFNSKLGFNQPDITLMDFAAAIQSWLMNPSKFSLNSGQESVISENNDIPLNVNDVAVVQIDLGISEKSPSAQAWSMARSLAINSVSATVSTDSDAIDIQGLSQAERDNLFYKVIDIWAVFSDPPETTLDSFDPNNDPQNQAEQMLREQYLKNFTEAINA